MKSAIAVLVAGAALANATATGFAQAYEHSYSRTCHKYRSGPSTTGCQCCCRAAQGSSHHPPPATTRPVVIVSTPQPAPQPKQPKKLAAQPETLSPSGSYQQTAVDYHNAYRKDHSAGILAWDETLAQYAANTANGCVFEHDMNQGDGHYGQNLGSFESSGDLGTLSNAVGDAIAKQWYDEVKNYNFYGQSDPPPGINFNSIGHFTQLVWKSTQKVGCSTVKCPAGTVLGLPSLYTVCNYSPPGISPYSLPQLNDAANKLPIGNFKGQYGANVLPSLGHKISLST